MQELFECFLFSEIKYKDHIEYCQFRKAKKLMSPFKKYMKFENLKNCILNNWIIHSDFECTIDPMYKRTFIYCWWILFGM